MPEMATRLVRDADAPGRNARGGPVGQLAAFFAPRRVLGLFVRAWAGPRPENDALEKVRSAEPPPPPTVRPETPCHRRWST